jgi:signal transduction histidine kinase
MVYLSITDTGKGIAADQQSNIFQPFDRAGEEGSAISGTGLGLVITKNLIEKMKGSIGFTSTEHEGSCFWIKVPLSKDIG